MLPSDLDSQNTVAEKILSFFSHFQPLTVAKNQIIITPKEEISSIYLIKKGLVRMYIISEEGEEATLHVFKENSFFPMMLSLSKRENKYYFEAMEETEVMKAPTKDVTDYIKKDPELLFDLTIRFADAITGFMLRIEQLISQSAYQKIVSLLLYLIHTSGKKEGEDITIYFHYSHEQLGTWVGVARETVSRQMEKLEEKGIISQKEHNIVIKDMTRLQGET